MMKFSEYLKSSGSTDCDIQVILVTLLGHLNLHFFRTADPSTIFHKHYAKESDGACASN